MTGTPWAPCGSGVRLPPARYDEADEIETECPMCTLELDGGEWVHERSRLRARHRTA